MPTIDLSKLSDRPWPYIRAYLTKQLALESRLDSASDAFAFGYLSQAVRFDLGKICSRGKPCGNSCVPRKWECRKDPSKTSVEASARARKKLIGDLKSERDRRREKRRSTSMNEISDFEVVDSDFKTGFMVLKTRVGDRKAQIMVESSDYGERASTGGMVALGLDVGLKGLIPNINHVFRVIDVASDQGDLSPQEHADLVKGAIAHYAKNGDLAVVLGSAAAPLEELGKDHPLSRDLVKTGSDEMFSDIGYIGTVKSGQLASLPEDYQERMSQGNRVRSLRFQQFGAVDREFDERGVTEEVLKAFWDQEDETAEKLGKTEDEWMGRKPKKGAVKSANHYKKKADEWAKSQGLGDFANGFTSEATKAHDLGHPITHEMIGMDSNSINKALGGLKQKDGKPSLVAEEAIVNVVEHLSRGDSLEASILNGVRLARVLSRNTEYETDEAREYVRSKEFKDKIVELSDKLYRNDNFTEYMKLVRQANRVSKTVTAAGDDFTNSASGG